MSRKLVNVRVTGTNGTGPCIEGWVDTGDCAPMASRPIYTLFEGGTVIPNAVITPAGACPPAAILQGQSENTTLQGQDCAGLPLTATGPIGQLTQVVQAPGQVLTVRMCPTTQAQDREMVMLCAPDGVRVIIQNVTPDTAPLGTAPVIEAWTLSGAPYTGVVADLVDCGIDKVNTERSDYCAAGQNYTRVDGLSETTGAPVWTVWLNDVGVPVAAPSGAVKGICVVNAAPYIYIQQNTAVLTMAGILAATGAASVQSITVKQTSGVGSVTADAGTGAPLDKAESWSWASTTTDTFGASALSFNAGTGEQRITAIYYL
jgi:hypothetical protein